MNCSRCPQSQLAQPMRIPAARSIRMPAASIVSAALSSTHHQPRPGWNSANWAVSFSTSGPTAQESLAPDTVYFGSVAQPIVAWCGGG